MAINLQLDLNFEDYTDPEIRVAYDDYRLIQAAKLAVDRKKRRRIKRKPLMGLQKNTPDEIQIIIKISR